MHHCVTNLHSRGEAVEDQSAGLGFENGNQFGTFAQVLFCAVNRRGQVPFKRTGDRKNLIAVRVPHEQSGRAENFRLEVGA